MRYQFTDYEWAAVKPILPNKPRCVPRVDRQTCPQWHLLGVALRRTVARSAGELRPIHYVLQLLCAMATGRRLGKDRG